MELKDLTNTELYRIAHAQKFVMIAVNLFLVFAGFLIFVKVVLLFDILSAFLSRPVLFISDFIESSRLYWLLIIYNFITCYRLAKVLRRSSPITVGVICSIAPVYIPFINHMAIAVLRKASIPIGFFGVNLKTLKKMDTPTVT